MRSLAHALPVLLFAGTAPGLGIAQATPPDPACPEGTMRESEILEVTSGWKDRVFLVVSDGGPCRVTVSEVLQSPSKLYRNRRVGCAIYVGERRLLLTTASVVGENSEVAVFDQSGTHLLARLIGQDQRLDLALLEATEDLPGVASLGSPEIAEDPQPGSSCLVLGNAYGRSLSATLGRIGSTDDILPGELPVRVIRVHAPVFPGDSGAPLLDGTGRFVGILTAVMGAGAHDETVLRGNVGELEIAGRHRRPAGLSGFALPASQARQAWMDLREHGHVRRGFLGVLVSLSQLESEEGGGAVIEAVVSDSPAARMGLRPGDRVIGIGAQTITSARQFFALVAATPPQARLEIRLLRDEVEHMISGPIDEAPKPQELHSLAAKQELDSPR